MSVARIGTHSNKSIWIDLCVAFSQGRHAYRASERDVLGGLDVFAEIRSLVDCCHFDGCFFERQFGWLTMSLGFVRLFDWEHVEISTYTSEEETKALVSDIK